MREEQKMPNHRRHSLVYRFAMAQTAKRVLILGIIGGFLYGLLLQLPFRFLFNHLLNPDIPLTDTTAVILFAGQLVLLLIGLIILLYLWGRWWTSSSHRQQYLIGAGIGLIFALMSFQTVTGGVSSIIAGRQMFNFLYRAYDAESPQFLLILGHGIEHILLEVGGMALLAPLLLTGFGAVLSRFLISIDSSTQDDQVRDTFVSWVALLLPPTLLITGIVNVVIWALLQASVTGTEWTEAGVETGMIFLLTTVVMVLPWVVMVASQLVVLLWLIKSEAQSLHRSMLRLTQILYGLLMGALQIGALLIFNPNFVHSDLGKLILAPSVVLAWVFVIIAQVKLRRARKTQQPARIVIPAYRVVRAGTATVIVGLLLINVLIIQAPVSLTTVVVRLIGTAEESVTLDPTIDRLLQEVLHEYVFLALGVGIMVVVVSAAVLYPLAWLVTLLERRTHNQCPHCHKTIHFDAGYCPACGHDLSQPSESPFPLPRRQWLPSLSAAKRFLLRSAASTALGLLFLFLAVFIIGVSGTRQFTRPPRTSGLASPTPIPMIYGIIAVQEIPRGVRISPEMISQVPVPVEAAPYNVLSHLDDVIGTAPLTDIVREQYITRDMLAYELYDTDQSGRAIAYEPSQGTLTQYSTVSGILNDNNPADQWLFQSARATAYTFTLEVTDGDLRAVLTIWGQDSEQFLGSQAVQIDGTAALTIIGQLDETVIVDVRRAQPSIAGTAGPYQLTVQPVPSTPYDE